MMEKEQTTPGQTITLTDSSNFFEDVSQFYSKQTYSDVDLVLDGQKVPSHKVILAARSKYFDSLFTTDSKLSKIVIADVPSKAFLKILKYVYTGCITLVISDVDVIFDVIELAGKYSLKSLEVALSEMVSTFVNMDTVFNILNKATLYDMEELKNVCLLFMDKHSAEVLQSERINNLTQKSMVALLERDSFPESELKIFLCVAKWSSVNKDDNNLVIQKVRLNCLTIKEILTVVRPTKLVNEENLLNVLTEISDGIPETARPRIFTPSSNIYLDQNFCTSKFEAEFISGNSTDVLLMESKKSTSFAYHSVGDTNGITVKFRQPYCVNHICMKLWDAEICDYSYYVEVSSDEKNWKVVVDYSKYSCRSVQNLYFKKMGVQFIRIVGTFSTVKDEFRVIFFEVYLRTNIPKMIDDIVCPLQNVAVEEKGAVVILPENM